MKNDLTAEEWIALAAALNYTNEEFLYAERGDVVHEYEVAVEKVNKVAEEIRNRQGKNK
ncbi:hypothetical protein [Enterococcus sp. SMC-9]|uniref:hypothetical protein n=1 Tax=Enterococcus sp. SMC-9 TaxID=2862343 RepID=UPI001E2E79BF|nr:hypothetical protein [Enterococcus sp. SMC-9]MCD1023488.1 hypothetical protein [Enterococcus sp. SMC-9]